MEFSIKPEFKSLVPVVSPSATVSNFWDVLRTRSEPSSFKTGVSDSDESI